jgi:hypothetical protein
MVVPAETLYSGKEVCVQLCPFHEENSIMGSTYQQVTGRLFQGMLPYLDLSVGLYHWQLGLLTVNVARLALMS